MLYELKRRFNLIAFEEHIKDLAEETKAADKRPAKSCKLLHKLHGVAAAQPRRVEVAPSELTSKPPVPPCS